MAQEPPSPAPMLPPDGTPWPPRYVRPGADTPPPGPDPLPGTTPRRPAGAEVDDWRTMPADAPDGYLGTAGAPPAPQPRVDAWAVTALLCAVVGAVVAVFVVASPVLAVMPVLAIGFGAAGWRNTHLTGAPRRGRIPAAFAIAIGAATLAFLAPIILGL